MFSMQTGHSLYWDSHQSSQLMQSWLVKSFICLTSPTCTLSTGICQG